VLLPSGDVITEYSEAFFDDSDALFEALAAKL
jgi:hypothetical protein